MSKHRRRDRHHDRHKTAKRPADPARALRDAWLAEHPGHPPAAWNAMARVRARQPLTEKQRTALGALIREGIARSRAEEAIA